MSLRDLILSVQRGFEGGDAGRIILLLVVLVVIAFVGTLIALLVYSRTPRGRLDALLDERADGRDRSVWIARLVPVLIVLAALLLFDTQAGKPAQCLRCHTQVDYAGVLAETSHGDLDCLDCHGSVGIAAIPADAATYARWMFVYASEKSEPEPRAGSVTADSCLACHSDIVRGVVERYGVRVRHSDFLEAGSTCRECHNSVAHGDLVLQPTEPAMNTCVVCHDGLTASNDCAYCHVVDPIEIGAAVRNLPKRNELNTGNCYACHDERPCLQCHGVTMPHPEGWATQEGMMGEGEFHARDGFVDREVCWRCHYSGDRPFQRPQNRGAFMETEDGCTCHGAFGIMHGGTGWVREHGLQATGRKPGVYAECYACHDRRYFCDMCHEPDVKDRYAPRPGADAYRRDVPLPEDYWVW